jgi:hypothetical protein
MPEASVEPGKRRLRARKFLGFGQNQKEQRPKTTPTTATKDDASHASTASTATVDGANLNIMQQTDNTESSPSCTSHNISTSAPELLNDLSCDITAEILASTEAKAYKDAVDKLRQILSDTKGIDQFPVEVIELPCTFADIDCVVKSMSSAIADFVETRKKLKQNKSQLRGIVETCYKTSLPFVQGSLNVVTVRASGP